MMESGFPDRATIVKPGLLSQALRRLLMRRATVRANEELDENYRRITLEGPALRGVAWSAGQKVQIAMGAAFAARTYTPIEWSAEAGRTTILGYVHGGGPGSAWLRGVEPGDECDILGPRASVDARTMTGPLAVFGDETSIGLAAALVHQNRERSCRYHFEVEDRTSAERALAGFGIAGAVLLTRMESDRHLAEMEAALPELIKTDASFLLTGKASTIQRLRQSLGQQGVSARRVVTKAYWAPGKIGLD